MSKRRQSPDDHQTIQGERQEPTFFAMVPKMAQRELSPYELALYANYKQTIGESNGKCTKSNATLARETHMSVSQVKRARDGLRTKKYIDVFTNVDESGVINHPPTVVVRDIWALNHQLYAAQYEFETGIHKGKAGSHGTTPGSDRTTPQSPQNHKEEPIEEKPQKEEQKTPAPQNGADAAPLEKPKRQPNAWYDAVHDVWGYSAALNGEMQKMLQGKSVKKGFKEYNLETPLTSPADLKAWAAWYRRNELHDDPKLNMVAERIKIQSSITAWQERNAGLAEREARRAEADRIWREQHPELYPETEATL